MAVIVAAVLPGSAMLALSQSGHGHVNASERKALLRRAQIWKPTDVASMNIVEGPQRKDGFKPGLNGQPKGASVDDWVAAFKKKREEIAATRCIG